MGLSGSKSMDMSKLKNTHKICENFRYVLMIMPSEGMTRDLRSYCGLCALVPFAVSMLPSSKLA